MKIYIYCCCGNKLIIEDDKIGLLHEILNRFIEAHHYCGKEYGGESKDEI